MFTVPAMLAWLIPAVQTATVNFWSVLMNVILLIPLPLVVSYLYFLIKIISIFIYGKLYVLQFNYIYFIILSLSLGEV